MMAILSRSVGDKVTADIIRKYIEYQTHEENASQLKMFEKPWVPDAPQLAGGSGVWTKFSQVLAYEIRFCAKLVFDKGEAHVSLYSLRITVKISRKEGL